MCIKIIELYGSIGRCPKFDGFKLLIKCVEAFDLEVALSGVLSTSFVIKIVLS
jgi:hypothetical protein